GLASRKRRPRPSHGAAQRPASASAGSPLWAIGSPPGAGPLGAAAGASAGRHRIRPQPPRPWPGRPSGQPPVARRPGPGWSALGPSLRRPGLEGFGEGGALLLVLHAHLPYVRHPAPPFPLEA